MFLGHHAVAFASKRLAPRVSLGWLVSAAILIDLLWPAFLLLGWERVRIAPGTTVMTPLDFVSYPITHSLIAVLGWAVLFGGLYWLLRRDRTSALVIGGLVLSHWVLDFIMHRPDLPLVPGGAVYGLGLWNSAPATLALELGLLLAGVWLYVSFTRRLDRAGSLALASYVALLLISYAAATFGPLPPDETALAYGAFAQLLFVPWAFWINRHRVVAAPATAHAAIPA